MGMFINDKGYVCYIRSGVIMSDTHGGGGREQLHKMEFEEMCNEIVDKKLDRAMVAIERGIQEAVSKYGAEVWKELVEKTSYITLSGICTECNNRGICHSCAAMAIAETGKFKNIPKYLCEMMQSMQKLAKFNYKKYKKEK